MPTDCINYQESGFFSKLIVDYLDQKPSVKQLYHRFPLLENFKEQLLEKQINFPEENRKTLVSTLENQYKDSTVSKLTKENISLLAESNTFTITTGHQLNLFTGPLYFLYKIVSTINLCRDLKNAYPQYHFVPVYWMATEDHDFEEINFFRFKHSKIKWSSNQKGAVGRFSTEGLEEVFTVLSQELALGKNADDLRALFKNSYLNHSNLADATRYLVNELFGNKGLVILDGDAVSLKKIFAPYVREELFNQLSFQKVSETNTFLEKEHNIQVNPREINLFYVDKNLRERIIAENNHFKINNTDLHFSKTAINELLEIHPEKFSPNVILRPLYQEVVLPNLCYIGGGGELAYWLQLKANFDTNNITFPILLLRNSVLLTTEKQLKKADNLNLTWKDLFSNQQELFNKKTIEYSKFDIDFTQQKEQLKKQFDELRNIANQTDKSFVGAVNAQEAKQLKGLENLEKRLLKAEKRVYTEKLDRILQLQNELFPNQSLQERIANFSEFYLEHGAGFIEKLFTELHPLEQEFKVIVL